MKKGWKTKKLGELCDFFNGLWIGKRPPFQNVGVIRNTNFTKDGKLDYSNIVFLDVEKALFARRKLLYGDIILEKSGGGPKQPVGRVIIFDKKEGDYSFSNFTSVLRIKNYYELDFTYLHRYLFFSYISGLTETMQSHSTGIRNLKFDKYKAIEIPLPPLPEQHRIVSLLDQAFAAINKAKANAGQNLKNAKELFESYLQGVFENNRKDWEHVNLGEICKITDGTHFSPKNSDKGEYMYITAKNIKPYRIDLTNITYISEKDHKEIYSRCSVKKGDILYIKDGATAGIATINTIDEEFSLLSSVALLKCTSKILNSFLVHYMNSKIGKKNFLGYIDGAAITRLTIIKLNMTIGYE
jgi:type I restriction enzyme, S subunit